MNAKQIQSFLRTALSDNNICVAEPIESKKREYIFAIFKSEKDLAGYTENNYENEYIVIWENDPGRYGGYGFSHEVFYPGVHMRSDGTGEPDMYELEEHDGLFVTIIEIVKCIAEFMFEKNMELALENYSESKCHVD